MLGLLSNSLRTRYLRSTSAAHSISRSMATIQAKPFKLALLQLGGLGADKTHNLKVASEAVKEAASNGKADLVVLPVRPTTGTSLTCGGGTVQMTDHARTANVTSGDFQFPIRCNRLSPILGAHSRYLPHQSCRSAWTECIRELGSFEPDGKGQQHMVDWR
jgi:hypothetical protein